MKRHLELTHPHAVADFAASVMDFLPAKERPQYKKLVDDIRAEKTIAEDRLVESARAIGSATWAERRAFDVFLNGKGADMEWKALLDALKPNTAALLKQLQKSSGAKTVGEALNHSDAAILVHEKENDELALVRPQIRLALWGAHKKEIKPLVARMETERKAIQARLEKMRALAGRTKRESDLLFPKIEAFEDRLYFGGETIPLEILDAEMQFALDDVELPPEG